MKLIEQLPAWTSRSAVVIDLGSVKRPIVESMSRLPVNFDPIGGHPICGKETLSLANADAGMYRGAPFCLTPLARSGERAMTAAFQIVAALGAQPLLVDAEHHDRMFAATSHLPFLLSSALALTAPGEAAPFIGPGFRSASRLAGTPVSMMSAVLRANRANVVAALDRFQSHLADLRSALVSEDETSLNEILDRSRSAYEEFASAGSGPTKPA
jgi:prephenate dehydrogenase